MATLSDLARAAFALFAQKKPDKMSQNGPRHNIVDTGKRFRTKNSGREEHILWRAQLNPKRTSLYPRKAEKYDG